jgi:dienelactone hydrolase
MTRQKRRRQNLWIASEHAFLGAAWYWPSRSAACATTVILVSGVAHEERTMNGGMVALAESLADAGLPALLIDLHGCAQSAGRLDDADIGMRWRENIRAAVRYAHESGAARVIVIGARLGFLLAADALAHEPLAALVAWAPIANGKRYVRELKVMQRAFDAEAEAGGTIAIAGFSIPPNVTTHVSALDLAKIDLSNAPCLVLRDTAEGLHAAWVAHQSGCGLRIEQQMSRQIHSWLFASADQPDLPHDDIKELTRSCRALHDKLAPVDEPALRRPAHRPQMQFVHRGRLVRETFVEVGPSRMTGILSEPIECAGAHAVRLLMSTVGPGRTFTDFARDEASRGHSSLRFDFEGFGTSGRAHVMQGGELYTHEGGRDVQAAIAHLRQAGHQRIYGLGFCAGAWSMMQAEVAPELRAAVAINVALYRQPGPETPDLVRRTRKHLARLSPLLARSAVLQGVAARIRRKDRKYCEAIEWLMRLCSADVRVLLAYADLDPGLDYLTFQMNDIMRGRVDRPFELQVYDGLGHLAEGLSARTRLFEDIGAFFADLDRHAIHDSAQSADPHSPAVADVADMARTGDGGQDQYSAVAHRSP